MGMILTINTNGTLLGESWADFFAEYRPRRINITLYGADAASYNRLCHYPQGFDQTVRAIRLLRERKRTRMIFQKSLLSEKSLESPFMPITI